MKIKNWHIWVKLIGNIAHQWRQPLSAISTGASSLVLKNELGLLEKEDIKKEMEDIIKTTRNLSNIIDTFRNYLEEGEGITEFILQDKVMDTLNISDVSLRKNHIKLIKEFDMDKQIDVNLNGSKLSEMIVDVIQNAQDIIIERNVENPWVKVDIKKSDNKAYITIEDNAGGISEENLPKIFDPYFTTSHQSQGKGLGLHMCHKIATEILEGDIYAENGKEGAILTIELPITK